MLELIDELKEYGFTPNRITASELTKCYMRRYAYVVISGYLKMPNDSELKILK